MSRLIVLMVVVLLTACADQEIPGDRSPSPTPSPEGETFSRCTNPDGFEISYPSSWHANDQAEGERVCSQFHPEPFDLPAGDQRVAAITAYIDPVPFHVAAAPDPDREEERAVTVIDGYQAVRLRYEAGADDFFSEGTPISVYVIDLARGVDEGPGTLFVDAVGLSGFDYEDNRRVLDRMARSMEIMIGDDTERGVVARYEGAGGFSVVSEVRDDEACLRIPPAGDPVCTERPDATDVRTAQLVNLQDPMLAGVTGEEVFRVTANRRDGTISSVLPAPFEDARLRGFTFVLRPDEVTELRWFDLEGRELGSTTS